VTEVRQSFWRRRRWAKWVVGGLVLALVALAVVVDVGLRRAEPFLRARIVQVLSERFHARVELDSFHVSLMNGLWAEGKGLRIWPPNSNAADENPSPGTAAPVQGAAASTGAGDPLIRLAEFRFHAPLAYSPGKPIHISLVELHGLIMHVPPRSHYEHSQTAGTTGSAQPAATTAPAKPAGIAALVRFDVDTVECIGAQLVMETNKPGKLPLDFEIAHLRVNNVTSGGAMAFEAELTNPRPRGIIHSKGSLGPWPMADPGQTPQGQKSVLGDPGESPQGRRPVLGDPGELPITGDYQFDHADLSTFKGIAGILSSTGHYQGTLRNLTVEGQTDTPDFRLTHFGNAMSLKTHFHARVDGTDGDTWLQPVDATLGRSHFTAQGQVVRVPPGVPGDPKNPGGHDIALTVNVDKARIEDFLRLTSRSGTVLMTGDVTVKAALHVPPGPAQVHERVNINGRFALDKVRFTSQKIQGRIAELSLRGQGRPDEVKTADATSIPAQMQSSFQVAGGVVTLPAINFTVPGAQIQLKGTYGMDGGALNFAGTARMDATVSKMVGGWKGVLLKPADRFLKKDGAGTQIPIHIEGTREAPQFGIDFGRMKPGAKQPTQPSDQVPK